MSKEDQISEEVLRLRKKRDPEGAVMLLRTFLEKEPGSIRAKLNLASIYFEGYGEGEEGAKRLYSDVIEIDPNNVTALTGLALLSGTPSVESIRLLYRVTQLASTTQSFMNLAYSLWWLERFEEAAAAFERALEIAQRGGKDSLTAALERTIASVRRRKRADVGPFSLGVGDP